MRPKPIIINASLAVLLALVPLTASPAQRSAGAPAPLQELPADLRSEIQTLCQVAPEALPLTSELQTLCNLITSVLDNSAYTQRVEDRLTHLGTRISSIAPECAPPFYINWNEHIRKMTDALVILTRGTPTTDIDTQRRNIQGHLAVVESSVAYQELYARELCSHYRTHLEALATLERERMHEWPLFRDAVTTGLDTVGTVADEALAHFQAEHATARAYRVYKLRELDPDLPEPSDTAVSSGRDRSLLLSTGSREFVSTYFSVQRDGAVHFSLDGVPSVLRRVGGYHYESIGDFVVRLQSQPDFLDDTGPATRYLSAVSAFLQKAVTEACHRWLSHPDVFRGRFFDAVREDIAAEIRARFRRVQTAILDGVAGEVACRPGSSALATRSSRAFDELYDEREASEQRRYAQEYGQRFDRMNWVGQRTMDAIWIERILLSEAPMEEVRALLAQYDQEYQERTAARTRAYLELERLREANAYELAVAQEESRRALAQATDQAQWHYKEELLKLEGIRLQVTTNAKLAVETRQLELDAERAAAMRAEEEKWRRAVFEANTELEREQLRQRAETGRARLEAETARMKARIDREGNILSAAARAIDSIFGN